MCGIWASIGILAGKDVLTPIAHRGPDGDGWVELDDGPAPVRIGHRRLAIIDLSEAGAQPMASADGRYHLTYNGEIYNFRALRRELEAMGHQFYGHSDTEVLLHAYMEWGVECLQRFNGMFAFAIWDSERRELFAARDRIGIKPLYFHRRRTGIALASEMKQILALDDMQAVACPEGVERFLLVGRQSAKCPTMFQGIENLPPAHFIQYRVGDDNLKIKRWYCISTRLRGTAISASEFLEIFPGLMRESVALRLQSDVDVGALLSGGLDSSTIVALAATEIAVTRSERGFVTFTSWADDVNVDERQYSRAIVERYRVRNIEAEITDEKFAEDKDRLLLHQEEPFFGTSVYAQWNIFDAVRRHTDLKVVLDGQGSDEMLVGYYYMLAPYLSHLMRNAQWLRALMEMRALGSRHERVSVRTLALDCASILAPGFVSGLRKLLGRGQQASPLLHAELEAKRQNPITDSKTFEHYERVLLENTIYPQMQWQDRNAMAFSIEARHPFLDYRLIELMLSTDPMAKVQNGRTKALLRTAMAPLLPHEITNRDEKFGFPSPHRRLMSGALREDIQAGAKRGAEALADYVNVTEATSRLDRFRETGDCNEEAWMLYNFDRWRSLFGVSV